MPKIEQHPSDDQSQDVQRNVHERRTEGRDERAQDQQRHAGPFEGRAPTTGVADGQDDGEGLDHLHARREEHGADEDDGSGRHRRGYEHKGVLEVAQSEERSDFVSNASGRRTARTDDADDGLLAPPKFVLHRRRVEPPTAQQHERVEPQVGGLLDDPLIVFGERGHHQFDGLLADLSRYVARSRR